MALNWVLLNNDGRPTPLPEERFIRELRDVDLSLAAAVSPDSTSGSVAAAPLKATGLLYISQQRMVFVSATGPSSSTPLHTLSIPLIHILETAFNQPWFSANYLSLLILPVTEGGLTGRSTVEIRLRDQGMFEFVQLVERVRTVAIDKRRVERKANTLPAYIPPPGSSQETPTEPLPGDPPAPAASTAVTGDDELPPAYTI